VAVGDFNGDGKPDLVVANSGSGQSGYSDGSVSVLLGQGDGTFHTAVNYTAGLAPRSVAVGDLNGDGKPDMAVANWGFPNVGSVSLLLGRGDGTFQDAVNYRSGDRTYSVAVADFNGDGKLDLVAGHNNGVAILLGNGDGTLQPPVNYGAGAIWSVAVGDLNGDSRPDLIVAGFSVLLNTCDSARIHLDVTSRNSNLTLSWPLTSSGFVFESTTNLSSTNWQRVLESPMTNSGRLELTAPFDQPGRFFRLRKP